MALRFFNIDKAIELPQTFNVLHNALDELYAKQDEQFQISNPLKEIYKTVPLDRFQKTFASSTGFTQAFEQTVDYAAYPGFTNGDGFKTTIYYQTFSGKVVITEQTLLEGDAAGITETLSDFQIAWQRQVVEFGMFALTAFFTKTAYDKVSKTNINITSADTTDGNPLTETKNPVFSNAHTVVRKDDMTTATFNALKQSNKFYIDVALDGTDPLAYAKLADGLNQIKVIMNKYLNDNGKRAGVGGRKKIVATEDAHLNMAINSILEAPDFSHTVGRPTLNPCKNGFDTYFTPYLDGNLDQEIPQFAVNATTGYAQGLLILDPAYNAANKGPMMVERVGFKMKAVHTDEPDGIKYLAKQAFAFFCPSWRGTAYVHIGTPDGTSGGGAWNDVGTFTKITPVVYAAAVNVVNTVETTVTGTVETQAVTNS